MRKKQLKKELDEAHRCIAELETKCWIYEGIIQASDFDCCITHEEKPEMGFMAKKEQQNA